MNSLAAMKYHLFAEKTILRKKNMKTLQRIHIASSILIRHEHLQQKTSMKIYNHYIYMSYSNGLLETPSTKRIEGIPGVGFKLTPDGNYDMENKKLTNLKPGTDDTDVLTKKQIYDRITANSDDSPRPGCSKPR